MQVNIKDLEIKDRHFFGFKDGAVALTVEEVTIPEGVTVIESDAFHHCHNLKKVILPKTLIRIDDQAFVMCNALKELIIPPNVKSMDNFCVGGPEKIILDEGFLEIEELMFQYNRSLEKVELPKSLTEIKYGAFESSSLKQITLPKTLKKIGVGIFFESDIEKIAIEEGGITEIPDDTFAWCAELQIVELSKGIKKIGNRAFNACGSLEEINIPNGVTHIGDYAFAGCKNLKEIKIPSSVAYIGENAFIGCDIEKIKIRVQEGNSNIQSWSPNWNLSKKTIFFKKKIPFSRFTE